MPAPGAGKLLQAASLRLCLGGMTLKKLLLLVLVLMLLGGGWVGLHPDDTARWLIDAERARNGLTAKTVVVDGEVWPYLEGGKRGSPAILMIHGFSADKDNWTRYAGAFVENYRVIAPDLPGFGEQSRDPGGDYRLGTQVQRLRAFTQAVGLESFHMVGNSMGGHMTALYALAYPQQVHSAALFDNAGINSPVQSDMRRQLEQGVNPLLTQSVDDFDRVIRYAMEVPPFLPWPVKPFKAREALAARDFNAYIFGQISSDRASGLEDRFAQISVPVLVLWGRQDRLLDVSSVDVMKAKLPSARVVIMEDTGHMPMVERPLETARYHLGFIRSIEAE